MSHKSCFWWLKWMGNTLKWSGLKVDIAHLFSFVLFLHFFRQWVLQVILYLQLLQRFLPTYYFFLGLWLTYHFLVRKFCQSLGWMIIIFCLSYHSWHLVMSLDLQKFLNLHCCHDLQVQMHFFQISAFLFLLLFPIPYQLCHKCLLNSNRPNLCCLRSLSPAIQLS